MHDFKGVGCVFCSAVSSAAGSMARIINTLWENDKVHKLSYHPKFKRFTRKTEASDIYTKHKNVYLSRLHVSNLFYHRMRHCTEVNLTEKYMSLKINFLLILAVC